MIGELPTKWTHQNVQYMIEKSDGGPSFEKCYSNVLKTIEGKFLSLPELNSKEIYAFSYFFDRFRSARLLKNCKFKEKNWYFINFNFFVLFKQKGKSKLRTFTRKLDLVSFLI